MKARLVRHGFADEPSFEIVRQEVPLGTVYEVLAVEGGPVGITRLTDNVTRPVTCWYVTRDGDSHPGWIPSECLEIIES